MARAIERGEIWRLHLPNPDKRRPVLVLSRSSLIRVLHTITVAAITSTLRGSPTEIQLGTKEGLKGPCCVNLINLFTVPKSQLRSYVGALEPQTMQQVCRALQVATGCDPR